MDQLLLGFDSRRLILLLAEKKSSIDEHMLHLEKKNTLSRHRHRVASSPQALANGRKKALSYTGHDSPRVTNNNETETAQAATAATPVRATAAAAAAEKKSNVEMIRQNPH